MSIDIINKISTFPTENFDGERNIGETKFFFKNPLTNEKSCVIIYR